MKISDIITESFQELLQMNIQDVIMMFKSNDIQKTTLENIKLELSNRDFNASIAEIKSNVISAGYEVEGKNIVIDDTDGVSDTEDGNDIPDSIEGNEYNPAADLARKALRKRM